MEAIVLAGDWHGNADHAGWVIEWAAFRGIEKIFQVGDFGLWEHDQTGITYLDDLEKLAIKHGVTVYCLGGNHDNEKLAIQLHGADFDEEGFILLRPHVRLACRGHHWTWDGTRFLALGGAYSVDKLDRTQRERWLTSQSLKEHEQYGKPLHNYTETLWFPDEEITEENVITAIGDGAPVDVMLTHDKPLNSSPGWNRKDLLECRPNQEKIQRVIDRLHPNLLVHGHLHYPYHHAIYDPRSGDQFGTYVVGLDADAQAMVWEKNYRRENSIMRLTLDDGIKSIHFNNDELQLNRTHD